MTRYVRMKFPPRGKKNSILLKSSTEMLSRYNVTYLGVGNFILKKKTTSHVSLYWTQNTWLNRSIVDILFLMSFTKDNNISSLRLWIRWWWYINNNNNDKSNNKQTNKKYLSVCYDADVHKSSLEHSVCSFVLLSQTFYTPFRRLLCSITMFSGYMCSLLNRIHECEYGFAICT